MRGDSHALDAKPSLDYGYDYDYEAVGMIKQCQV